MFSWLWENALGQSDHTFLKKAVSLEQLGQLACFACWESRKVNGDFKKSGKVWS